MNTEDGNQARVGISLDFWRRDLWELRRLWARHGPITMLLSYHISPQAGLEVPKSVVMAPTPCIRA